jgi:all-trans-retinol 13,14-reductase
MYYLRKGSYLDNVDKLSISASEFIESITDNAKLRMVLAGNNPLYAGTRNATPWYVHALIVNSYIESSWKMVGGGSQIAKELIRVILDKGGVVKNRSKVVRLEEIDGKISFAETEDGSKYYADHFISSIHPSKTLELTQSRIIKQAFRSRIKSLENSTSFFVVNITLKPNTFKNEKSNYYCYMKDDVWALEDYNEESWPPFFAIFFTSKVADATYADGLSVMTYMRMDEVSKWAETYNTTAKENRRGVDYEQFKKDKTERILSVLENQFPHLRDSILNTYASTPLTFRDYMGTDDGSIYGIKKDCNSPGKSILSPRTKIGNLYLTGQNLNLHGILGVTISALVTCTQLVDGDKLIDDINEHEI